MSPMPASAAAIRRILSCVALLWLGGLQAQEFAVKTLTAGPFSVKAPAQWAESALVEKVPAQPLYSAAEWRNLQENPSHVWKPAYANRPQHWAIRFPALALKGQAFDPKNAGDNPTAPQILIHQTDGWATIFENGAVDPEKAAKMRSKLSTSLADIDNVITEDLNPALADGSLSFICLKKKLCFKGGYGYRMLAQWTYEADLVRRKELHYLFIGLSNDNSCQILATFPVDVPGLPSPEVDAEHLGYSNERYEELSDNISAYHHAAVAWIEQREKKFTPSLEALDRLIESLSADTWR